MLKLHRLSLRRGLKLLFEDVDLTVHPGWKTGIIGANGCGKSSLFELIRGQLSQDDGDYRHPPGWTIAHVAQETPATSQPAVEYVMDGDGELCRLRLDLEDAEAADQGNRIAELHHRLDAIHAHAARGRAARLMNGLGFLTEQEGLPVEIFSGGWRVRLNLARALMCRSDLLLLDEPTNHLDLDAVIWLEDWLRGYPGTLLLISHDRDFLDAVCTHIAHMERQRIHFYTGNYSAFEHIRAERLANQRAEYQKQQREISHVRSFVERFRAKATKARQAQSRLKALERMELIAPAHVDSPFQFRFRSPAKAPNPLMKLEHVQAGYGDVPVLDQLELSLAPGDRLGLLGPNGAGKSTLIKLLAGELSPLAGQRETASGLTIGYFAQHQLEQLNPEHTALDHLLRVDPRATEQALKDFLGGFGFQGDRALEPVAPFSGGEKARLVLALIVYRRPNLLLLDEPTNHLDLEMRHTLGRALQDFHGAMVIVSHDRHLLRITADRLLLVHGGRVDEFTDSLDDYAQWLSGQRTSEAISGSETTGEHTAASRRERKRREAEQRKRMQPLRRRLADLEKKLERQADEQAGLEAQLTDTTLYGDERKDDLKKALADKARVDMELAETEEAWLEITEELEQGC